MGAQRHLPHLHEHDSRAPPPPNDEALTLPLDQEELRMLSIFHKSFNLPGLRFGLVRPVIEDDYYPPDDDFEHDTDADPQPVLPPPQPASRSARNASSSSSQPRRPRPVYEEPDTSEQLSALLQKTRAMHLAADQVLAGEGDAPEIEDEAIGIEDPEPYAQPVHQRQVLSRPGSSSVRPGSSGASKPSSASGRRPRW